MTAPFLTKDSLSQITDVDLAFGTTKLLPPVESIPEEFWRGNQYTHLLSSLFFGYDLPNGEIEFRNGFDGPETPALLNRALSAHLQSFSPKHEHKIAGLAFLLSQVCEFRLAPEDAPIELPPTA